MSGSNSVVSSFSNDDLDIPFHNILAVVGKEADLDDLDTQELVVDGADGETPVFYELNIKYLLNESITELVLTKAEYMRFKADWKLWLDYRTHNMPVMNEHITLFVQQAESVLEKSSKDVQDLISNVSSKFDSHMDKLETASLNSISKNQNVTDEMHEMLKNEIGKLSILTNMIESFTGSTNLETDDESISDIAASEEVLAIASES
jgi:hypothetical protein